MAQVSFFSYYVQGPESAPAPKEGEVPPPPPSDVKDTYDKGSKQLKARTLSKFKILAGLPRSDWHEGYFKHLAGECDGLCEVRFTADNVEQRPLGFHISESEFVVLYFARKKGDNFIPKRACEIALRRKREVLQDRKRYTHEFWLILE